MVLWLTGLSGAGKTTLAHALQQELTGRNYICGVLDGDDIRGGLSANLGFSKADRTENNRRVAEVARLMAATGMIVIVSLISPYRSDRRRARKIVETSHLPFFEVFVDTPLEVCEKRDPKGLYKRARSRQIRDFTGVHAPYERPRSPDISVFPATEDVASCVATVLRTTLPEPRAVNRQNVPEISGLTQTMDAGWQQWVRLNLERKCAPEGIKQILLENGFAPADIAFSMGDRYPPDEVEIDYQNLANVRITRSESGAVKFESDEIQLYTLDHFLPDTECDALVQIVLSDLKPSTVTVESNDKYFRTSSTCYLTECRSPLVEAIDQKIAATLGINIAFSEGIQAQRYLPGQQFKHHTDYFEPGTEEYKVHCANSGNRTWTFMVYLSDVEKGGGTAFKMIGHTFFPKKGRAVIWNNLDRNGRPNRFALHSGEPVLAGEKVIITKWFREKGAGAMFPVLT